MTPPPSSSSLVEKVAAALNTRGIPAERIEAAVRVVVEAAAQECTAYNTDAHPDCAALCALAIRALCPAAPDSDQPKEAKP